MYATTFSSLTRQARNISTIMHATQGIHQAKARTGQSRRRKRPAVAWLLLLVPALTGCGTVGVHEMGLVSRSNMLFSESAVFQYDCPTLSQLEPGLSFSGGAQSTTCTACQ